jgi:hypothetical protein
MCTVRALDAQLHAVATAAREYLRASLADRAHASVALVQALEDAGYEIDPEDESDLRENYDESV